MMETWLPQIDANRCTGCGDCVAACPVQALALNNGKATLPDPTRCTYCRECESLCPQLAIDLPFLVLFGTAVSPTTPLQTNPIERE